MKKIIKKADIILFCALVALGIALTVIALFGGSNKAQAAIYVDGKLYGTYSVDKPQTIEIENGERRNKVQIGDGTIQMLESTCDNQICVHQGVVSWVHYPIVCLPNRVEVVILNGEEGYDAVAG